MQLVWNRLLATAAALVLAASSPGAAGAAAVVGDADLGDLSLDQLMGITVTSASKKEQNADEVPSAIFVLTSDDIRRSGATSIPEALRLVPGMQVARSTSNSWAVTSRGFNGRFASKLLVLIDGRSVYTPLFSGVYWDVQDTLLEDVDRIEVIRGPGATVWGANAVNGVINIITKDAKDTQGLLTTATAGSEENIGGVRWGGAVGDDFHYRGYAKYFDRDAAQTSTGSGAKDEWDVGRVGFRSDWSPTDSDKVTFQGDFYDGDAAMTFTGLQGVSSPIPLTATEDQQVQGWNLVSRWEHSFSETMDASLQFYYDRTERTTPLLNENRDTLDLEFQHRFALPFDQEVIWGGGYRFTQDDIENTFSTMVLPDEREDETFSFFVQDEIRFFEDRVRLTMGTKVEHNDYTGWEYQPSIRAAVLPHEDHTFWAAVSRAVRTPSRAQDDVVLNQAVFPAVPFLAPTPLGFPCPVPVVGCPPTVAGAVGDNSALSERVYAFEVGWRARFFERVTLDVAAFYNDYNYLTSVTALPNADLSGSPWTLYSVLVNDADARTRGVEVDLRTDVLDWWRVIVGYTFLHNRNNSLTPSHQGVIRSQMDLPFDLALDATLYLVGNVHALTSGVGSLLSATGIVPSYERLDLRLGWRPTERVELSLVGQNLLDNRHPEFLGELGIPATEVQRAVYGKIDFRY